MIPRRAKLVSPGSHKPFTATDRRTQWAKPARHATRMGDRHLAERGDTSGQNGLPRQLSRQGFAALEILGRVRGLISGPA